VTYRDLFLGGKRRDRTGVICNLLDEARKGVSITGLIYRTNLNHNVCKEYVAFLIERGLLEAKKSRGQTLYITTKRGEEFLHHYVQLRVMFSG